MLEAELVGRAWRRVDVKLSVDGALHLLRWRRGWFFDTLHLDERCVGSASGLFGRDTTYGFALRLADGREERLLFSVDAEPRDAPSGLERANGALVAVGTLGPPPADPFRQMYDRALKALGLA